MIRDLFTGVVMLLAASPALGQNRLCDTRFLEGATQADVQRLVDQGADANRICVQVCSPCYLVQGCAWLAFSED